MHHLVALLAGCLLHPPADDPCKEAREAQSKFLRDHGAREVEWHPNGTVGAMKATGIFLRSGVADLKVDAPAPQILEAIGPAVLARGTEELRVRFMSRDPRGDTVIKLDSFMNGRRAMWSGVNVLVKKQTNEVTEIYANFMPDRGLDHRPRLSPVEARLKAESTMRETLEGTLGLGSTDRELSFSDTPAYLTYEFEKIESSTVAGGALVWVFSAQGISSQGWYQVCVDAATGKVVRLYPPRRDP